MSTSVSTSIHNRVFHRKDWTSREGLFAFGWGLLAALFLIPLVFSFLFLMELVESHGKGVLSHEEATAIFDRYEMSGKDELPDQPVLKLENSGLLPIIVRNEKHVTGLMAGAMYQNFSAVRTNQSAINFLTGLLVISLLLVLFSVERNRSAVFRLTQMIEARMRRIVHRQVLRLGQSDLTGEIHQRAAGLFGKDTLSFGERFSHYSRAVTCEFALTVGLIVCGLMVDWLTFLICLLPLEAGWLIWRSYSRRSLGRFAELQEKARDDLELLESGLGAARLVRGYGMEEFEQNQFQALIDDYHHKRAELADSSRWTLRIGAAIGMVLFLIVLLVLVTKMTQSMNIPFALPRAMTLVVLVGGISLLVKDLGLVTESLKVCKEISGRIHSFLELKPQVGQAVGAKFLPPVEKSVYCESVTYTEPNATEPLLDKLDLKIKAGEVVGLVSLDRKLSQAVALLMPRLIEPQSGRILFDGEDIAWGTLESIRAETMIVSADDPVLTGSVLQNLTGSSTEYSLQQATDAAKQARAHNFLSKLPKGYETKLGAHGHQLNEGQRYLLSLARALLRDPAFLILDEPKISLSSDMKDLLDDAYSRIFPNRTVLILPGRLSTVKKADRVIVLHQGRVAAVGTHQSLVQNEILYRHWEYSRFNEFRDEAAP